MRLARWRHDGRAHYGLIEGDRALAVSEGFAARFADLDDVLAADALAAMAEDAGKGVPQPLAAIAFRLPVAHRARVICVGINFAKRYPLGQAVQRPEHIILFAKLDGTLAAHGETLELPGGVAAKSLDYEGEIGVVIGRPARDIDPEQALDHVAGYTVLNDGSVREWQRHSVHAGKNFARSGACGPWITTADEIAAPGTLRQVTRLNGEVVQDAGADEMYFAIPEVISYISKTLPLRPGDLIAMGSPEGTGASRTPPRFLREGDVVEIEVGGVGVLRNRVGRRASDAA